MSVAPKLDDFKQAQSDAVLIDLDGSPIWYQIHLNPTFKEFIEANDLACIMQRSDRYGAQNVAFA